MSSETNSTTKTKPNRTERQYSRAVVERTVPLNTVNIQKVHRRSAEYAANGLFNLEAVLPVLAQDKEHIVKLLEAVGSQIQVIIDEFANTKAQYMALMETNGIEDVIGYTHTNNVTFQLYSPLAGQLTNAFAAADELISLVDTLWMAGIVDAIQRKDATYSVQQRLSKLCGRVGGLGANASREARKANAVDESQLKSQDSSELDEEALTEADSATIESVAEEAPLTEVA